ncbi:ATP-binding cassette domain-containing protein [Arenibacter sp. GZD96]|uniref:peptidase domain-containing ABC transporter n=1 Tax=Aurantibrevibacter litoralis TaxID=3106030 RepID=UPI002AFE17C4|nr:ATP-binding cassette domain-containing protein [Arenibacter sp. GZD-96]MEA1787189.1 ATP-binding cassette domain-containing protein [Arenibacter sp. GZD-96]
MAKTILTSWERFKGLVALDKKDILQILYYAIFVGLVNLSLPLGIQAIINLIQGAQMSTSWIVLVVLVTLGVAFAGVLQLMQIRIIENIQQKIFTRSAFEFAHRFPKIKMEAFGFQYPPELANRFFDTLTVQKSFSKILVDVPAAALQILFGLMLLSFYHPFFILYGFMLVALVYVVFKFTAEKGLNTSLDESKQKYKVAHWIQEIARSITAFKISGKTSHAMDKSDALVLEYLKARESHFRILVIQFIQMIGFKVLVTAGLLLIGGLLVLNQQMNIGQFVAAEIIILLVINSVEKLIFRLETFYDLLTSLEKLGQVVDKDLEAQTGDKPQWDDDPLTIELKDVSYKIEGTDQLAVADVSMIIPPNSKIWIPSASSSGKTTLLQLIGGLITPTKGTIYINNRDLIGINLNHYRSMLGFVLLTETPFEGTILDNITFGDKRISNADVAQVLEKTGLTEFVKKQSKGIHTTIFPEGQHIPSSVGKKIILARSLVRKPKLLLLKEPLDQIDELEANTIMDYLVDPSNPWSLIVISKNPRWGLVTDRTLKLANGKLIDDYKAKKGN